MGCVTTMKITDKKQLVKLTSFLAMSDGSIHRNGGTKRNVFSFSQVEGHEDFLDWVEGILNNVTSTTRYLTKRKPPRKNIWKIQTKAHPFFDKLRDRIYTESYKGVDPHALKLLDWESLAILYMCDGCLGHNSNKPGNYTTTLSLCRLSYGDQVILKKALKEKLDLEWNVVRTGRKYWTLRLRAKDFDKFMYGIEPYIMSSFRHKLELRTVSPQ